MARTYSNIFRKGASAPYFALPDVTSGKILSLSDVRGEKGTVISFICNHCPFVLHINEELVRLGNEYKAKGIGFAAISSNDIEKYPQDAPDLMKAQGKSGYSFPYLYDETQEVALLYDAACLLICMCLMLVLKLYITDNLMILDQVMEFLLRRKYSAVLDAMVAGKPYLGPEKPSIGCNIKWR